MPSSSSQKALSLKKKLAFFAVFIVLSFVLAIAGLLTLDLWLHHKYAQRVPNWRGYRGPVVGKKQPNELRLAVVGGSTAFGFGVVFEDSFPAMLESDLRRVMHRPVSVVNLAMNAHGAYSFLPTLQDYTSLDYDGVILYEGYNDMLVLNKSLDRRDSPLFRTLGYYPVIPIVVNEKLAILRRGHLQGTPSRVEFRPNLADRTKAGVLESAMRVNAALHTELAGVAARPLPRVTEHSPDCSDRWAFYCNCVQNATDYAVSHGKKVFVVTQPYIVPAHVEQQRELAHMLQKRFGGNPEVVYVNLGNSVDLRDPRLAYDGMHLVRAGNEIIARGLVEPIVTAFDAKRQSVH